MKVLVLHASALHLGFLGCYGNTWITTPNLDRLAAEGVVFDQHHADNLSCQLSVVSCQSSADGAERTVRPFLTTGNWQLTTDCVHIQSQTTIAKSDATPLERTLEAAVGALEGLANKPRWLCWVDLPSLHPPWDVAEEFTRPYLGGEPGEDEEGDEPFEPLLDPAVGPLDRDDLVLWERLRCTYAGAVTYLDAGLGLLIDELKKRALYDDLMLIFTAQRGLALGEHGIVGDLLPWLHEEVVHVPLIVRQPRGADAGLRVDALTQPLDLAATLLDLFSAAALPLDGRSWLPLLRGELDALRPHTVSVWKLAGAEEWALRTLKCALVMPVKQPSEMKPRSMQLYLKPEDRWEVNNVVQHHLELAEELERTLRSYCGS